MAERVALVHDWVTGLRGGERVLDELAGMYPDADLYTLFHRPGSTTARIDSLRVHPSPLSNWPGAIRHHRKLLPLYPWAIENFRLTGYDLVVSTSHAVAKGVRVEPGTPHLCYCFTPMRYVWDQADAYLGRGLRRVASAPMVAYLRHFDRRTATPERVSRFVAISDTVARRIRQRYDRRASVVYPPVRTDRILPNGRPPEDFFLMVAAFVPYKQEAVAIEAFADLGHRLVVVGDGPGRERLSAAATDNVEFVGRVCDRELADLYARCRALVYTSDEDFGLVPVEAQCAGRPVIALRAGGALESVVDLSQTGPTGLFYGASDPGALAGAVRRFESIEAQFEPANIRANAERFDAAHFREGLREQIQTVCSGQDAGSFTTSKPAPGEPTTPPPSRMRPSMNQV